jgi:hypothetical protein
MAQSFGTWLKHQSERGDAIGDFAADFVTACRWRKENPRTKTRDHIYFQMACMSACSEAYEALDAAAAEWEASR